MTTHDRLPRQLPPGVRDLFGAPARALTRLSAELRDLFERWGYSEVVPPTFEYYDTVMRAFDDGFAAGVYRVVDPDGHLLALRPDLTVPVARLAASKLYTQPMPLRMSYVAPVYRFTPRQGVRRRELWQAGWELVGAHTAAADAEILALLIAALGVAGVADFQINLGHMGYARAVLDAAALPALQREPVERAIDRKNSRVLQRALNRAGTTGPARAAVEALPELWGEAEVLDEAERLSPGGAAADAVGHLRQVVEALAARGVAERVTIDLGEVRGMDYYTGITFEVFAAGSGQALASGGRYDDLLGRFGQALPAVGAMIELERLLERRAGSTEDGLTAPDILVAACTHAACLARMQALRDGGRRVVQDPLGLDRAALVKRAAEQGIPQLLHCLESEPT